VASIKTVLVDDEQDSLDVLEILLEKHCTGIAIAGTFTDPKKAVKAINTIQPELLFLDVEMPGTTGFELLQQLKGYKGGVIFVTAHTQYAVKAFKFSAIDYLLKPVDKTELKAAVERFEKAKGTTPDATVLNELKENLKQFSQQSVKKISVSSLDGIELIPLDDILYLEAERNYTHIERVSGKHILASKSLKEFEAILPEGQFMRIHSSYIINLQQVVKYNRHEGGYAVLTNGKELGLGRVYKDDFVRYVKATIV
jgi:two-component system, LytTR family, response regulator